jgi:DNA polymerase elongation subunit (family B)
LSNYATDENDKRPILSQQLSRIHPKALEVVKAYRQRLVDGEIPTSDLIIIKHLPKNPEEYRQHVSQLVAAKQLIKPRC